MNWHYFACNRCGITFRTTVDNPDLNIKCANCEYDIFHEITKAEYEKARREIRRNEH